MQTAADGEEDYDDNGNEEEELKTDTDCEGEVSSDIDDTYDCRGASNCHQGGGRHQPS